MDLWATFEQAALTVLEREVDRTPIQREALEKGLHLLAMAKNQDANVAIPPFGIFTDNELVDMVRALLAGEN